MEQQLFVTFFEKIASDVYGQNVRVDLVPAKSPPAWGSVAWNPYGGWWRVLAWDGQTVRDLAFTLFHELGHVLHGDAPKAAGRFLLAKRAITGEPGSGDGGSNPPRAPDPAVARSEEAADAFARAAVAEWFPVFRTAVAGTLEKVER